MHRSHQCATDDRRGGNGASDVKLGDLEALRGVAMSFAPNRGGLV